MSNLTEADRRHRMKRFEALVRLGEILRRDPNFLALPPQPRRQDEQAFLSAGSAAAVCTPS